MNNSNRKYVIIFIFLVVGITFVFRLFHMQVIADHWKERAAEISEFRVITYPSRGMIFDRNEEKLVVNRTCYDIQFIPSKVKENDTNYILKTFGITKEYLLKTIKKAKNYSPYLPYTLVGQLSRDEFYKISPKMDSLVGFFEQERTLRQYPKPVAAHVLGYLSKVDSATLANDQFYTVEDYFGKSGIERIYENELRGEKGVQYLLKDAIGKETGQYEGGKYDTLAVAGNDIQLTLDVNLQAYAELLMQNKVGSVVAIEPKTGEILSMVTAPNYDPNLLTGREIGKNYGKLIQNDSLKPLFNRAAVSKYPPGSIVKMLQALIGLEEGVIDLNTGFPCKKDLVNCHNHGSANSVITAVQYSCNPYFYYTMRRIVQQGKKSSIFKDSHIGLDIWAKYMESFGLGNKLDVDFPKYEMSAGRVPNSNFYDNEFPFKPSKPYGKYRWAFSTIYSNSIGQGEVEVTPLQMANFAAIIANQGWYVTPHFIKKIGNKALPKKYSERKNSMVSQKHFPPIIEAMRRVVEEPGGTARRARTDSLHICGKTGTAQNPHGEDHSVFIAFAPMNNPKIAVAVYVENGGFGGTWAAPIASLVIEKYLKGKISNKKKEKRILEQDFIHKEEETP